MASFRFLHVADLHLDSPLRGLERYEGAPVGQLRSATREALVNLVDLAIDEGVAFVVVAGDVFDGDWKDYNTGLFFSKEMSRLRHAGIPVFLIAGNHDAASQVSRTLTLPDNVTRFPSRRPATERLEALEVAVHGQSFARREVLENLAAGYPDPVPGWFNIGLLHTSATGRKGHDPYAPCTVEELAAKGYQYWALGHIHAREVLHDDPPVIFSGNLQGRNIRETGPKGGTLVDVRDGEVVACEMRHLHVLEWARLPVAAEPDDVAEDVLARVRDAVARAVAAADGRLVAGRLEVEGACRADAEFRRRREHWENEWRAAATDAGGGSIWIEKIRLRTTPVDRPGGTGPGAGERGSDPGPDEALGGLLASLESVDGEAVDAAFDALGELAARLPAEIGFDPADAGLRARVLADVKARLEAELGGSSLEGER